MNIGGGLGIDYHRWIPRTKVKLEQLKISEKYATVQQLVQASSALLPLATEKSMKTKHTNWFTIQF